MKPTLFALFLISITLISCDKDDKDTEPVGQLGKIGYTSSGHEIMWREITSQNSCGCFWRNPGDSWTSPYWEQTADGECVNAGLGTKPCN